MGVRKGKGKEHFTSREGAKEGKEHFTLREGGKEGKRK